MIRDEATPLRRLLRQALTAIEIVVSEWIAADAHLEQLADSIHGLRRDVVLAIVLLEEPERPRVTDPGAPASWTERPAHSVLEASRAAAITAALRVNAALGAAYQDRWAPPRTVLAACYAVARLIDGLHRPPAADVPRWN